MLKAGESAEIDFPDDTIEYKIGEWEIPRGYTLRLEDGCQRIDPGHEMNTQTQPISGTIHPEEDPQILVSNQKGWGLTVQKVWSDAEFMESHDPIYFAVYLKGSGDGGTDTAHTLMPEYVRQLMPGQNSVYYFFSNLQSGIPFSDYEVFEVEVTGNDTTVDANGKVTGFDSVTPIADRGSLTIGGTPVNGTYQADGFTYTVLYDPGTQTTQNENVRTDTVTNSRPGIAIRKTDWSGRPLGGASFTLKDEDGQNVGAASYTSDENGFVTIAYLNEGSYSLAEIGVPGGYAAMEEPLTIQVTRGHQVTIAGDSDYYSLDEEPSDGMSADLTVRNRTASLKVVKVDVDTDQPIEGVHFALYRQVIGSDGLPRKDYYPMAGYEDLVTDENGILQGVSLTEPGIGTYYLVEMQPAGGYERLKDDVIFTIDVDGGVSIASAGHQDWLTSAKDQATGHKTWTVTVPNSQMKRVSVWKTDEGYRSITTGGPGTLWLRLVGFILAAGAVAGLKQRGRFSSFHLR